MLQMCGRVQTYGRCYGLIIRAASAAFFELCTMNKPLFQYPYGASLEEKVLDVLALLNEPTVEELAATLVEL